MAVWALTLVLLCWVVLLTQGLSGTATAFPLQRWDETSTKITPRVFIVGMFEDEGSAWHNISEFNVLEHNITVPGLSPRFPSVHCTLTGTICQLVAGEGEINAAASLTALALSPLFDLTKTYFLIAGIAGVSPRMATLGSATFARFAVQVALQYEFDARERPPGFPTGYVPQGASAPGEYPRTLYGTEVFELNDALRQRALAMARTAALADDAPSQAYRAHYAARPEFAAAARPPGVAACDTATADTFWTGALLAAAFENATRLFTNGSAAYCTAQQEDNAALGALLRGARAGRVDFARVIVMRTASDFDRPFPGQSAAANLFGDTPGFGIALTNVRTAGVPVVMGIVARWEEEFEAGVEPRNYVGDIYGSLGGAPDFGPGSLFGGRKALVEQRRSSRWGARAGKAD
ncbi:purine nucleoside permease [Trametes meyenii]|nr:purine nucleoside permease [Trametes meyenii]